MFEKSLRKKYLRWYFFICSSLGAVVPRMTYVTFVPQNVCVCFLLPIYSERQVRWMYLSRGHTGGRSHRISHPPSFSGACLYFSRKKDSDIPFLRRL